MVFLLIANRMLMKMGGENGVAVFDLVQNTSFLILYLYDGVSKTAQPLISTFVGECNSQGLKKTLRLGYGWGLGVGGLGALFVFCFPGVLCMIFGLQSPEAEELGCYALRVPGHGLSDRGYLHFNGEFLRRGKIQRGAFCIAALRGAICLIPCALFFSMAGLKAFWWMYPAAELLTLVIYGIWRKWFGSRRRAFDRRTGVLL